MQGEEGEKGLVLRLQVLVVVGGGGGGGWCRGRLLFSFGRCFFFILCGYYVVSGGGAGGLGGFLEMWGVGGGAIDVPSFLGGLKAVEPATGMVFGQAFLGGSIKDEGDFCGGGPVGGVGTGGGGDVAPAL